MKKQFILMDKKGEFVCHKCSLTGIMETNSDINKALLFDNFDVNRTGDYLTLEAIETRKVIIVI